MDSPFIPTSNVWDVSQLYQTEVTSPAFKELLVRLYQNVNNIATLLNIKDTGIYSLSEFVNGQVYFPNPALNSSSAQSPVVRQVFRTTINSGALPNAATSTIAHGLAVNGSWTFTRIYGCASNTTAMTYLPLPYASTVAVANNIQLSVDATNVYITTGINYSAYNISYVILEYIKN